nr:MAG TPA: hypothetical protein [Caudoviricetes sp.]
MESLRFCFGSDPLALVLLLVQSLPAKWSCSSMRPSRPYRKLETTSRSKTDL